MQFYLPEFRTQAQRLADKCQASMLKVAGIELKSWDMLVLFDNLS
jgi:hypothetical protein